MAYTRLRPHWRPTHDANPIGFDRWLGPDGDDAWCKILNPDGHLCRQVWSVAPHARLCLRLHPIGIDTAEQKAALLRDPYGFGEHIADVWHEWVTANGLEAEAQVEQVVFEFVNEAPIWEAGIVQAHNVAAGSFAKKMRRYGYTAVIGNFNTGWPGNTGPDTPVDWSSLTPTLHAVRQYGHYLGLHEYCDARGPVPDWGWNMGRYTQLPQEFRSLPILITECGYDRAVNAPSGTGNHGWAGELSIDTYMEYLTEYDRRLQAYPNLEAAFIFTHDFDEPWGTWDTRPLLDRLCGHAEWVRQQPDTPGNTTHLPLVGTPGPTPPTSLPPEPQPPQYPAEFVRAINWLLPIEGGYTDNDEGAPANYGINQAANPDIVVARLTRDGAIAIYYERYWLAAGCNAQDWPLSFLIFDSAVQHGVGRTDLIEQDAWRDSGPIDLAHDDLAFMGARLQFYAQINEDSWQRNGRAWMRRMGLLLTEAARRD